MRKGRGVSGIGGLSLRRVEVHEKGDNLRNVGGEDVSYALLQIVEDESAFSDALSAGIVRTGA